MSGEEKGGQRDLGAPESSYLLKWLELLSRKERQWLLSDAMGEFKLSHSFRAKLAEKGIAVPNNAKVWMDYPLDWIFAACRLAAFSPEDEVSIPEFLESPPHNALTGKTPGTGINSNQEDVDLLIAYHSSGKTHLVMVEAKGETSWSNRQVASKARRLGVIFGKETAWAEYVIPRFVITSPTLPQKLEIEDFPSWMLDGKELVWIKLHSPDSKARIERWDPVKRKPSKGVTTWRIVVRDTPTGGDPMTAIQASLSFVWRKGKLQEQPLKVDWTRVHVLNADAGINTKPGNASGRSAIGVLLRKPNGEIVDAISRPIGWTRDHHVAEYRALIEALRLAQGRRISRVLVKLDSLLVVRHLGGVSRRLAKHLESPLREAESLISSFALVRIDHVPRRENADADALASRALGR